jgi:hypothetical protein
MATDYAVAKSKKLRVNLMFSSKLLSLAKIVHDQGHS